VTPSEAYTSLIAKTTSAQIQTLILGSKAPNTPIALNRVQLTKDLANDFSEIARKAIPPNDEVSLLPYVASYNPRLGEVMYISLDTDAKVKPIVDDLIAFQNIEHLKSKTDVSDNLKFYSLVYGVKKDDRISLIRATSEKLELSKGVRLPAILRSGTFSKLKQQVFLFDRYMDGAAAEGYFFIFNKKAFERLFQYYEELRANAENTVNLVTKYIPISNLADFKTACTTQVRFMDKLASVSRSPYLTSITIEQIKAVIKEFDLSVPIVEEEGTEKIVFEKAPEKRWEILKLLDDDYLRSVMTNEKYAANSKLRLSAK
jgi:Kiwa protein KwaB-like